MTESVRVQELINAVSLANSTTQLVEAVRALAAAGDEAGINPLIAVLGYNNPTAALAAVEGLIRLDEAAVQPLIEQLDGYNYGARAYAIRALAAIADPRALDVLLTAAATDFAPSVRRAAAKGLGNLDWQKLDAQQQSAAQAKAWETLLSVSADADWSIRYAAVVGLQGLQTIPALQALVRERLAHMAQTDPDKAVRSRVNLAQTVGF